MAITKTVKTDKIEIVGDFKLLQIREASIIEEDGVELTRSFHRYVLAPGSDLTDQPSEVAAIANAVWTQEIIDAYNAQQQESINI
jgi:hypothetical protein